MSNNTNNNNNVNPDDIMFYDTGNGSNANMNNNMNGNTQNNSYNNANGNSYNNAQNNSYNNMNGNGYNNSYSNMNNNVNNMYGNSYNNANKNSYGNMNGGSYNNAQNNSYGSMNGGSYNNANNSMYNNTSNMHGNSYNNAGSNPYNNMNGNGYSSMNSNANNIMYASTNGNHQNNRNSRIAEIDLLEIARIIWRHLPIILLVTIIVAVATFAYMTFCIDPTYKSSAMMIVNAKKSGTQDDEYVDSGQLYVAAKLTKTYSIIIKSDTVLNQVIDNLDLDASYSQLKGCVSVEAVDETEVMNVSVTTGDPELSQAIANEITEVAPDIIKDTVEAGSVKIVSAASTATVIRPSTSTYTLLFALLAFAICSVIFCIIDLKSNKIKSADDINNYVGIPILGVIPTYNKRGEKK